MLLTLLLALLTVPVLAPVPHDIHLSHGRMLIEDETVVFQVRFFRDDLERALAGGAENAPPLAPTPEVDARVAAYFGDHVALIADGTRLVGAVVTSAQSVEAGQETWTYRLVYQAASPPRQIHLRNTLLMEVFEEQRNFVRVLDTGSEKTHSFYFVKGSEAFTFAPAG